MRCISKSVVLILGFFLLRLSFSCCRCPEEIVPFDFNTISIQNLDNSTWRAVLTEEDSMFDTAVAFQVNLSDSTIRWFSALASHDPGLGLRSAMAMQPCECPTLFDPITEINKISILTLKDLSPEIPVGTDVADRFLWATGREYLYHPMDSLSEYIDASMLSFAPERSFRIFYTDTVMSEQVQFAVELHYADGQILSDTTSLIQIKKNH